MRRLMSLTLGGLFLSLIPLAGCGEEEARSAPPAASPFVQHVSPWDTMPPESIYGATAVENVRVVPVELDLLGIPPRWEGMRIAALSDLQLGLWAQNDEVAAAAVRRAAASGADLVVLLGDYLAVGEDTATLARVLAPLRGRPTLAVLGDRDVRTDSLGPAIARTLSRQGIRVLINGSIPWVFRGDTAFVSGVDPELAGEPAADQEWILSQMARGTRRGLLLTHVPQLAARMPKGHFPGVLAGNTSCGRVEIPGAPRLTWLAQTAIPGAVVPEAPRFFRFGTSVMFVTCGVGYGFVPARFGAPPEVALITLHAVDTASPRPGTTGDSLNVDTLIQRFQGSDTTAPGDTTR